jgi:hypothetical protein
MDDTCNSPPHPGSTVFDPEAQTRRELAEVRPLSLEGRGEQQRGKETNAESAVVLTSLLSSRYFLGG